MFRWLKKLIRARQTVIRCGVEIHIDVTSKDAKGNPLVPRLMKLSEMAEANGNPSAAAKWQADLIAETIGLKLAACDMDVTGVVVLTSAVPGVAGEE